MSALNLFPARIEIGQFRGADGKDIKVYQSPEFARALSDLLSRVGGALGLGTEDLALLIAEAQISGGGVRQAVEMADATPTGPSAESLEQGKVLADMAHSTGPDLVATVAQLAQQVADLQQQLAMLTAPAPAENYSAQEMAIAYSFGAPSVDWERPGKIGAKTPNTGAFTTLNAGAGLVGAPAFFLSTDTTTGLYRIGADNWGMAVAGVKLLDIAATLLTVTGSVSATSQLRSTVATGTAPMAITSTTKVANLNADLLDGTDWAAPGTIGGTTPASAKFTTIQYKGTSTLANAEGFLSATDTATNIYASSSSGVPKTMNFYGSGGGSPTMALTGSGVAITGFLTVSTTATITGAFGCNGKSAQTAFALGAAATDLATVLVLANNLRTMAINNGTGA